MFPKLNKIFTNQFGSSIDIDIVYSQRNYGKIGEFLIFLGENMHNMRISPWNLSKILTEVENLDKLYDKVTILDADINVIYEEIPSDKFDDCSICLENFTKGHVIATTSCNHTFHKSCLKEWYLTKGSCPNCL